MAKKMLIDATHPEETRVVVVDGSKVEEFDFESENKRQLAGNIYLAKVTRVEPSLQAAFVDYGGNRHGFLAFSEIHPDYYQIPVADREALMAEERAYAESLKDRDDEDGEAEGQRKSRRRTRSKSRDNDDAKPSKPRKSSGGKREERAIPGMDVVDLSPEEDPLLASVESDDSSMAVFDAPAAETESPAPVEAAEAVAEPAEVSAEAVEIPILPAAAAGEAAAAEAVPEAEAAPEAEPAAEEPAAGAAAEEAVAEDAPAEAEEPPAAEETAEAPAAGEDAAPEEAAEESEEPRDPTPPSYMAASGPADFVTSQEPAEAEDQSEVPLHENEPEEAEHDDTIEEVETDDIEEEVEEARRPRSQKPRPRRYKIQEVIKVRQIMLVQVVKEERGNKGAALTTYLSLAGRYCVLMPNTARGGGISRKITQAADRKKLKQIATELDVPEGAGLIIRTAGAKRTKSEIKRDYEYLQRLWEQIRQLALKSFAPAKIYEEGDLIKRSIRDLYNREIEEVLVEGEAGYRNAKDFMKMIMPSHAKNVQQYTDPLPLFARHQVESYLDGMFNPVVRLKSGGYIVIGVTEALVAIDVNSGKATKEGSIEQTALNTNLEAADEVARQLRLRDLAGLIVIDFIDMEERKNNAAVEKRFKDKLKTDRARIQVGRISGFGLMEMSRQRLRPGMIEATTQPCHHCHGTGLIRSDDSLALSILRQIEEEGVRRRSREVLVKCPVGIANYLMNNKRVHIANIEMRYGLSVRIEADPSLINPDFTVERFKTASRTVPVPSAPVISVDTSDLPELEIEEEDVQEQEEEQQETGRSEPAEDRDSDGDDGQPKRRRRRRRRRKGGPNGDESGYDGDSQSDDGDDGSESADDGEDGDSGSDGETGDGDDQPKRRRRRRGGRGRKRSGDDQDQDQAGDGESGDEAELPAAAEAPAEAAAASETVTEEAAPAEEAPAEAAEAPAAEEPAAAAEGDVAEVPAELEAAAEPGAEPAAAEPVAEAPAEEAPAEEPAAAEPVAEAAAEVPAEPEAEAEPEAVADTGEAVPEAEVAPEAEAVPELEPAEADSDVSKPKRRGWWSVG
ncbi:ribonuclease E/G [Mangrovicoccus sp. HB161399]|uniref:Rne/Rng family ribonuclease n=1 Tax=Mangrovicoccus sp. HB161399 TaxID=2720392 RepID=UPI001557EF86|nr:ribonuclease E/G [Mangrovicoccus sp. HB161399]